MWIFCGGMARSGSTLQFQLTADLVERAGRGTRVEWVPPDEFPRLRERYAGYPGWKVWKSHECTPEMLAEFAAGNARGVYVHRDVRDVVASRMREGGLTFAQLWATGFLDRTLDRFDRWTTLEGVLVSRYGQMVTRLADEVGRIARHLGLAVGPDEQVEVAQQYTVPRQLDRIREAVAGGRLRQSPDGRTSYDPVSNLHPDHIGSGEAGEWRRVLTREELAMIEDRAGKWLVANGYPLALGRWQRAWLTGRYARRRRQGPGGRA
jgi:hypothetical protein